MSVDWVEAVKVYLKDAGALAAAGPTLEALAQGIEPAIETYIGRRLTIEEYDEIQDGNGRSVLYLKECPVQSVTSLEVNGETISVAAPGAITSPPQRCIIAKNQRALQFTDGSVFTVGPAMVRVVYKAGYDEVPGDIVTAGTVWIAFLFKNRDRLGITQQSIGGQQTYFTDKMPDPVKTILDRHRLWL